MELEIERVFGLPAHPLLAHAPVVLLPLTALGACVVVASNGWRRRIGWVMVGLASVTLVSVQLAIRSGEELQEQVRRSQLVRDHAATSDTLLPLTAAFVVALLGTAICDAVIRRRDEPGPDGSNAGTAWRRALVALGAVTLVTAVVSTGWLVRVGHSGAKAVWDDPERPLLTTEDD